MGVDHLNTVNSTNEPLSPITPPRRGAWNGLWQTEGGWKKRGIMGVFYKT